MGRNNPDNRYGWQINLSPVGKYTLLFIPTSIVVCAGVNAFVNYISETQHYPASEIWPGVLCGVSWAGLSAAAFLIPLLSNLNASWKQSLGEDNIDAKK